MRRPKSRITASPGTSIPVFRGTVEQAKRQCGCEHFEDAYLRLSDEEVDA